LPIAVLGKELGGEESFFPFFLLRKEKVPNKFAEFDWEKWGVMGQLTGQIWD
jgi:hypothetical protein